MAASADYAMGISDAEFERLKLQGAYLEPVTRRLIREAGIGPGMRVLDVGCGVGEVSRLVAEAVGPSGQVVAIDREPRAIERARTRPPQEGHRPIDFVLTTDEALSGFQPFDAAIGRYVLFHQADPVAMVRRIAASVRPGGVVAFHELVAIAESRSTPPLELWERLSACALEAVQAGLPSPAAGEQLLAILESAGLLSPAGVWERIAGDSGSIMIPWLVMSYKSILPALSGLDLPPRDVGDLDTLADRLAAAARAAGTRLVSAPQACGWAIRP